jgi:hypothetical protein
MRESHSCPSADSDVELKLSLSGDSASVRFFFAFLQQMSEIDWITTSAPRRAE